MHLLMVLKTGLTSFFSLIPFGNNLFTLRPTVTKFSRGLVEWKKLSYENLSAIENLFPQQQKLAFMSHPF